MIRQISETAQTDFYPGYCGQYIICEIVPEVAPFTENSSLKSLLPLHPTVTLDYTKQPHTLLSSITALSSLGSRQ